jgi:tetratricopeptide (TPR) repeat protein
MKNKPFVTALFISFASLSFAQQTVEVVQHNENKDGSVSQVAIYLGSPQTTICVPNNISPQNILCLQNDRPRISATDGLMKNNNYTSEDALPTHLKSTTANVSYTIMSSNAVINPYLTAYTLVLNDATQSFKDKNYAHCIDLCDYLLTINRDNPEAYFLKGAANYGLGKKEIAIKFLEIAAQKGSKEAQEVLQMHKR